MVTTQLVNEALRAVVDPEIQLNIVDIGLIYGIDITVDGDITIEMSLTSPGCPFGPEIVRNVNEVLELLEDSGEITVRVVWDPSWSPAFMSEEVRDIFGY